MVNRKADCSREYRDLLDCLPSEFDASRRVKIVQQLIANIPQRFQSRFFGEILDVSVTLAAYQETSLAEHSLDAQI